MFTLIILAQNNFLGIPKCIEVKHIHNTKILSRQITAAKLSLDISQTIFVGDKFSLPIKKNQYHNFKYIDADPINYGDSISKSIPYINTDSVVIMRSGVWIKRSFFFSIDKTSNCCFLNNSTKRHKTKIGCCYNDGYVYNMAFDIRYMWSGAIILQKENVDWLKSLSSEQYYYKFDFELYNEMLKKSQFKGYKRYFKLCKKKSCIKEIEHG